MKYYRDQQDSIKYKTEQNALTEQYQDVTGEIAQIQSSARITSAKTSLSNLKKNIAYVGTMGKP